MGLGSLATNLVSGSTFSNAVSECGHHGLQCNSTGNQHYFGADQWQRIIFNQLGLGSTILTNTNTYTGRTTVAAGTLQVGNGVTGNLASGVTVANNATLVTNLANGATFTPNIALSGANSALNAIQSGTNTFTGSVSGVGVINQIGNGTTILTNVNGFTGITNVTAGTLEVDGTWSSGRGISRSTPAQAFCKGSGS